MRIEEHVIRSSVARLQVKNHSCLQWTSLMLLDTWGQRLILDQFWTDGRDFSLTWATSSWFTRETHSCFFGLLGIRKSRGSLRLLNKIKFGQPSKITESKFRCILDPPVLRSASILLKRFVMDPWRLSFFKEGSARLVTSTPSHLWRPNSRRLGDEIRRRRRGQIKIWRVTSVGRFLSTLSSSSWAPYHQKSWNIYLDTSHMTSPLWGMSQRLPRSSDTLYAGLVWLRIFH